MPLIHVFIIMQIREKPFQTVASPPSKAFTVSIVKLVPSGYLDGASSLPVFAHSALVKTLGPSAPLFHNLQNEKYPPL